MKYHDIEIQGQVFSLPSSTSIIGLARGRKMLVGDEWLTWSDNNIQIGQQVHLLIAHILNGGVIPKEQWDLLISEARNAIRALMRWWGATKFKPREGEVVVYSIEHGFAGTIDRLGTIKQHPNIVDWKTGALNTGGRLQLGSYYLAYKEMYPRRRIHEGRLVHLDKETGDFSQEIIPECDLKGYARDFISIRQAIGVI